MDSEGKKLLPRELAAFTLPMAAFILPLALVELVGKAGGASGFESPGFWLYPLQTILCGALLIWFWREYELRVPRWIIFTSGVALLVFAVWIAPQEFFGFAPRLIGFNPEIVSAEPATYWAVVAVRFVRLVVIVPLVEEIFWRGFLLRYLVSEKFHTVPMGTFSWLSFAGVAVGFGLAHSRADWIAALIAGALYNCVAYRTKSLASCVLAHAITNLVLGLWIMKTRQWGFW
jgi:CAAX prenyl protease-like protein